MLQKLHLMSAVERRSARVSTRSFWTDLKWYLDLESQPLDSGAGTISWQIPMGDGTLLTDARWEVLLEQCRQFVWSLLTDVRTGRTFDAANVARSVVQQLTKLLTWMSLTGYESFAQIDSEASWEFYDWMVKRRILSKEGMVKGGALQYDLQILATLYKQREALLEAGVETSYDAPYDGLSVEKVAGRSANSEDGWISPLPDEVANALLSASTNWLDAHMDDVLRLIDVHIYGEVPASKKLAQTELQPKDFDVFKNEAWARNLGVAPASRDLRTLMNLAEGACVINIQGTSGIRISEVALLDAGINTLTGLPNCVKLEPSRTGLNELLYIESQVTKIHEGAPMRWVLGMRPAGSKYLPPAVQAITQLHHLYRHWRDGEGTSRLLVVPLGKCTVSREASASLITRAVITSHQRLFAAMCGGLDKLPDFISTSSGKIDIRLYKTGEALTTHQWRKTFALFVLRANPKLLPALSQHFKHMSLAMTEQGYIGNDPELLESVDSVRQQRTVQFILTQAHGHAPIAGGMAELVRTHRSRLKEIYGDKTGTEAEELVKAWVVESDLRIFFTEYGNCFIGLSPSQARCHKLGNTNFWLSMQPNYAHRSPQVCGSCKCYAVDGEHIGYWRARYEKNKALVTLTSKGKHGEHRVALERVRQSLSILQSLGAIEELA